MAVAYAAAGKHSLVTPSMLFGSNHANPQKNPLPSIFILCGNG